MRVCVVGQGPSAEGRGSEIDACDFVVRIKAFWKHGADDTGRKVDAVATYGDWAGWQPKPDWVQPAEYWLTQCPLQLEQHERTQERGHSLAYHRLAFIANNADGAIVRLLSDGLWQQLWKWVGAHPSTGFVAIAMALWILAPPELLLVGYDSVDPSLPDFWDAQDARNKDIPRATAHVPSRIAHNLASEKKRLRELVMNRMWLGTQVPTITQWRGMPKLLNR